ncbi:hypothetical protein M23134_02770 [Microscilla marina ATCC 23134]|uniref:Uncharacterized protein n=1 Tax=Microscilla marina ATCC 23134 TaxID=313606 RepID=A1ZWG0_MICM2|nr:hypothetical protein M23134_02770 [Microscilla marina ATCC 23134]
MLVLLAKSALANILFFNTYQKYKNCKKYQYIEQVNGLVNRGLSVVLVLTERVLYNYFNKKPDKK